MRRIVFAVAFAAIGLVAVAPASGAPPERRGCCSHHHGVCGCSDGHVVCCDKTFSPTCGC